MQNFSNFSFPPQSPAQSQLSPQMSFPSNFPIQPSLKLDPTLESKPKIRTQLNNNERGYYSSLLSQADPVNGHAVQGKEAVIFFKRSGLSVEILKKIWLLSSSNNQSLDRDEFYLALKLIAYAQNNIDVSVESVIKNLPVALPKFSAPPPVKVEKKEGDEQNIQTSPEQIPTVNNSMINSGVSSFTNFANIPNSFNTQNMNPGNNINNNLNNANQNFNNPQQNSFNNQNLIETPRGSINIQNNNQDEQKKQLSELESKISLDKFHKYETLFKNVEYSNSGFVNAQDAKDIFIKSTLPNSILAEIWKLVDPKKPGNFNKGEFIVALHLIMLARQNYEIPKEMPNSLNLIIKEYGGNIEINSQNKNNDLMGDINEFDVANQGSGFDKYKALENTEKNVNSNNSGFIQRKESDNQKIFQKKESFPNIVNNVPDYSSFQQSNQNQNQINNNNNINYNNNDQKNYQKLEKRNSSIINIPSNPEVSQLQHEINNEMGKIRSVHSLSIQEKSQDVEILNTILDNYQKIIKKLQDENRFFLEESKKIEDQKNNAIKTILSYQNNIDLLLNKNSEIKQKIIENSKSAIQEIEETAKNTLENMKITNNNKQNYQLNKSNINNFQNQNYQPIIKNEENLNINQKNIELNKPLNNYNNFNSENLTDDDRKNKINDFHSAEKHTLESVKQNENKMNNEIKNENKINNEIKYENKINGEIKSNNIPNQQNIIKNDFPINNYNTPEKFNVISNNDSIISGKEHSVSVSPEFIKPIIPKQIDSDQKVFANFGGFDVSQQEKTQGLSSNWGDFDQNFSNNSQQSVNPNMNFNDFGGFNFK